MILYSKCFFVSLFQILHSVIKYGEPTEIISLALMAAPCMKEIVVAMETKEIKMPADGSPITVRMCLSSAERNGE